MKKNFECSDCGLELTSNEFWQPGPFKAGYCEKCYFMSYYVESDGDRTPKDVYICESDGGRILTMECASEDRRFRLARRIVNLLNGSDAGFNSVAKPALRKLEN